MENMSERVVTIEELHEKEVINIVDGKRLGYPCDVQMDLCDGKILSIIVPPCGGFLGFGSKKQEIIIPWEKIEKIGTDIILVKCIPIPRCECENSCEKKSRFF